MASAPIGRESTFLQRAAMRAATIACALLITGILVLPATAIAHEAGLGDGDTASEPELAAVLQQEQAEALESLPPERANGTCAVTERVAGLGNACRTADGLFRIVLPNGTTMQTHGADAPAAATAAAPHRVESQTAIDNASEADVQCVTSASEPHVELVYAYPSDKPDRTATIAPELRTAIYQASAFVDAEARAIDPAAGRRIRVLCDMSGIPVVTTVAMDPVGASPGTAFSAVVSQLVARGYPSVVWNSNSPRRVAAFYDWDSSSGAAGTANLFLDDDPSADNSNNKGGRYAVEFDWAGSHLPHWDVLLHEIGHNMGAVSDTAPDTSGGGHCNDGLDIMCYSDGGDVSNYDDVCSVERFDCGSDSYFNPSPAGGTFLADNWNVASTENVFLESRIAEWDDGMGPDPDPPTLPGAPSLLVATSTTMSVGWTASTDARSNVSYVVRADAWVAGAWSNIRTVGPLTNEHATISGLAPGTSYRVRVRALDQASNETVDVSATLSTSAAPPSAPNAVNVEAPAFGAIDAWWPAVNPPAGFGRYDVELLSESSGWGTAFAFTATSESASFSGWGADSYRVRVRTVDAFGAQSGWRLSSIIEFRSGTRGSTDGIEAPVVSLASRTATSLTASWTATAGATAWQATLEDSNGMELAISDVSASRSMTFRGLQPGRSYTIAVVATNDDFSDASNASTLTVRTLADTTAPTKPKLGKPKKKGASATVTWAATKDDVGVARYEVQTRVGAKAWSKTAKLKASARSTKVPMKRGAKVTVRVRAVDASGNASAWASIVVK